MFVFEDAVEVFDLIASPEGLSPCGCAVRVPLVIVEFFDRHGDLAGAAEWRVVFYGYVGGALVYFDVLVSGFEGASDPSRALGAFKLETAAAQVSGTVPVYGPIVVPFCEWGAGQTFGWGVEVFGQPNREERAAMFD